MQNTITIKNWKIFVSVLLISVFSSCAEMLDDPTVDKNSGEDVTFLIVDFNFFNTRMNYRLVDIDNNTLITESARIWFTGQNANDIVNFAGEKHDDFSTPQGQIELTVDPNIDITETSPLSYAVHVEIDGYEPFSQGIDIISEGKKTFELLMVKESSGKETTLNGKEEGDGIIFGFADDLKSAKTLEKYKIGYYISWEDLIKCEDLYKNPMYASVEEAKAAYKKDTANFISLTTIKRTDTPTLIDRFTSTSGTALVALRKLESGTLDRIVIGGRKVTDLQGGIIEQSAEYLNTSQPDAFGFASFPDDSWVIAGTTIAHSTLHFNYTLISVSLEPLTVSGSRIKFMSNAISTFSIDGDLYDEEGQLIKTINFKGKFPETFILENVPQGAAILTFRSENNPSFMPIDTVHIAQLCCDEYEVNVMPAEGYQEYQVVLKIICPDNPTMAIAPTYSGEIRIKGSNDQWQGIDMEGGVVDILGKQNESYELQLLWEDEWETSMFSTEFDNFGNYINQTNAKVETKEIGTRIQFMIQHEFKQSICNDMGW